MTVAIRKKRAMDIGEYRGQKIHHLTCLGEDKEKRMHWIVRCDCGVVRSIPRSKFGVIKTCGCQKFGGEKKKEFIYHGGLNELKPKKAALSKELFYKFNVSGCEMSVEGILIQEYTNSATMTAHYVTDSDMPGTNVITFVYMTKDDPRNKVLSIDLNNGRVFNQ